MSDQDASASEDPRVVYLNSAFELVDKSAATLVKLIYSDGRQLFAVPANTSAGAAEPAEVRQALEAAEDLADLIEPDEPQLAARISRARGYPTIRREHRDNIYAAVVGYLDTNLPVTQYRNLAGRAIVEHYGEAFYAGYEETSGGKTVAETDDRWLTEQIDRGIGYVDSLFETLKETRKAGGYDADEIASRHADGYANTLDWIHGEAKARGNRNVMLVYDGEDGEESCRQCQKYKGKRHRASYWIDRDLMRRNGNDNFDCGRWDNCHHHFYRVSDGSLYAV